jgi:hypothetical protein
MKRESQQPLFVAKAADAVTYIEERLLEQLSVLQNANAADLFDDEQTS